MIEDSKKEMDATYTAKDKNSDGFLTKDEIFHVSLHLFALV